MIKKLLSKIRGYLPVSQRQLKKVIADIVIVMDGFATTSITQSQVYTGIIKEIETFKKDKELRSDEKPVKEVKGYQ